MGDMKTSKYIRSTSPDQCAQSPLNTNMECYDTLTNSRLDGYTSYDNRNTNG